MRKSMATNLGIIPRRRDYIKEVAIAGIVILEAIALYMGINGVVLTMVVGLIAGIAGYKLSDYVKEVT